MTQIKNRALILLRGLPGSGKTTLADILNEKDKYPVFSIDDYFMDKKTGEYKFEYDKNHLAYKQCEEKVRSCMEKKHKKIFVHNTFTLEWELEPYFIMASEFNYWIFVVTVENRHNGLNEHDISVEQIRKMAEKYTVKLLPDIA